MLLIPQATSRKRIWYEAVNLFKVRKSLGDARMKLKLKPTELNLWAMPVALEQFLSGTYPGSLEFVCWLATPAPNITGELWCVYLREKKCFSQNYGSCFKT